MGGEGAGVGVGVAEGLGEEQGWLLHDSELEPVHELPPLAGEGLLQDLVFVPPPQVAEQEPQSDQLPLIGAGVGDGEALGDGIGLGEGEGEGIGEGFSGPVCGGC